MQQPYIGSYDLKLDDKNTEKGETLHRRTSAFEECNRLFFISSSENVVRRKKYKIKVGHKKKQEGAIYEEYESNVNVSQGPDYVYLVFWLVSPGCLGCLVFVLTLFTGFFCLFWLFVEFPFLKIYRIY